MTKPEEAIRWIGKELQAYARPAVMVSFGKDSMVLLHLLLSNGFNLPVLYYRDPIAHKNKFADSVIHAWGLSVFSPPASARGILWGENLVPNLTSIYSTGYKSMMILPKNTEHGDGCGLAWIEQPKGSMQYPWDGVLHGHKDCDTDNVLGDVPLKERLAVREIGPDYLFPLKDWSDDDIWEYTEEHNLPIDTGRYENREDREDKTLNSDWLQCCIKCFDKRIKEDSVICPKLGKRIPKQNVWEVPHDLIPDYIEREVCLGT